MFTTLLQHGNLIQLLQMLPSFPLSTATYFNSSHSLSALPPTTTLPDAPHSLSAWLSTTTLLDVHHSLSLSNASYYNCYRLSLSTAAYYRLFQMLPTLSHGAHNNSARCSQLSLRVAPITTLPDVLHYLSAWPPTTTLPDALHSLSQHGCIPQLFWMPTTLT